MGDRGADDPASRHGGRKRSVNVREVLNGIFDVLQTGCAVEGGSQGPATEDRGSLLLAQPQYQGSR